MTPYESARTFIHRHARPLDLARWQFHFEGGSREAVLRALSFYQNADGGFAHALEPDCWNPESAPIQTWRATELLLEIGCGDAAHPIMQGILRYLSSGAHFQEGQWLYNIPTNNDHPHAIWWTYDPSAVPDYNPTAALVGFLLRFAAPESPLYERACELARQAATAYLAAPDRFEMHAVRCFLTLLDALEALPHPPVDPAPLKAALGPHIASMIREGMGRWRTDYVCTPSWFLDRRDSFLYEPLREAAEAECRMLLETQAPDGSWPVPWHWVLDYPEPWHISKNWWKSNGILQNLLFLRRFAPKPLIDEMGFPAR